MGYELHIVRQTDYDNEEEESSITLEEWLSYVAKDKELHLTNGYKVNIPGIHTAWQNSPGFCEWTQHILEDGSIAWFDFGCGMISAKYPDDVMIKKMINMSNSLNAKVRGDDFEYYDDNYFIDKNISTGTPATNIHLTNGSEERRPWWKFW